jgi:hypothetical protein
LNGFSKININQNVIVLIVGLVGLTYSEQYDLPVLFWISVIISVIVTISVLVSMTWYTNPLYAEEVKRLEES